MKAYRRTRIPGLIDANALSNTPNVVSVTASTQHVWNGSTMTQEHTVGSGANRLLVVAMAFLNQTTMTSVECEGVAMSQFGSTVNAITESHVELWYIMNPDVGANTIDVVSPGNTWMIMGIVDFENTSQVTPLASYVGNIENDGSPSIDLVGSVGDLAFSWIYHWDNVGHAVPHASMTQLYSDSDGAWESRGAEKIGDVAVTMSWATSADDRTCCAGVMIKKA